jgi:hypothetical protein
LHVDTSPLKTLVMTELAKDYAAIEAVNLLTHYGFDLNGDTAERLLDRWLRYYSSIWIRSAVIEALYQGRYKAISVEQILSLWQRREQPMYHFNHEFERIVCSRFPKNLKLPLEATQPTPRLAPQSDRPSVEERDRPVPFSKTEPKTEPKSKQNAPVAESPTRSTSELETGKQSTAESASLPIASPQQPSKLEGHRTGQTDEPTATEGGIQIFQPYGDTDSNSIELLHWSRKQIARHPIDQFIPESESSEFYDKLKAVAKGEEAEGHESANLASISEGNGGDRSPNA